MNVVLVSSGFRIQDSGFVVQDSGFKFRIQDAPVSGDMVILDFSRVIW